MIGSPARTSPSGEPARVPAMPDLDDLENILHPTRGPATSREEVETALQALLFHQFLYEDSRGTGRAYDLIRRYRGFFDRYFSAMGHRLVFESREGMVGLLPGPNSYGRRETKLSKDQTLTLLALRFVLETGARQGRLTDSGRIEATTDELFDAIKAVSLSEPPGEARMGEIVAEFRRRGLVRVEARDTSEKVTPIVVMPAVRHVCTDEFAKHLTAWAEAQNQSGDILDFMSERREAEAREWLSSDHVPEEANVPPLDQEDE